MQKSYNYLFVIGKNDNLSLAELQSVLKQPSISILTKNTILLKLTNEISNPQNLIDRLGGTIKICRFLQSDKINNLPEQIFIQIKDNFSHYRHIGFSYYGFTENLHPTVLSVKKKLQQDNLSKRFIVEKHKSELTAGTIKKNKLTTKGSELVIIKDQQKYFFGQTIAHQNVDDYSLRDYGKPKPDARSGMLPPKLAQIMINLAKPTPKDTVYDPFCGSGVVLQEALLMKLKFIGSDISEKAIIQTRENLKWLINKFKLDIPNYRHLIATNIFPADATYYKLTKQVECIVTEPYLGPSHRFLPSDTFADQIVKNLFPLYQQFISNQMNNLKSGGRLVFVLPVIKSTTKQHSIKLDALLDGISLKAYNIIQFDNSELLYQQPNQIITRKIIVLEKNN